MKKKEKNEELEQFESNDPAGIPFSEQHPSNRNLVVLDAK